MPWFPKLTLVFALSKMLMIFLWMVNAVSFFVFSVIFLFCQRILLLTVDTLSLWAPLLFFLKNFSGSRDSLNVVFRISVMMQCHS